MANPEHIAWLLESIDSWNERRENDRFVPDFQGVDLRGVFRRAGKIDSRERIPLAGANLRGAKLVGAGLWLANLIKANLQSADLTEADLRFADLTEADLDSADLTGAILRRVNLTRTYLGSADLTKADLFDADLTDADLSEVDLTGANFRMADLTGANLDGANLTGANLADAEPWKAILYPENDISPEQHPDTSKPVKTIQDLLTEIQKLKDCYDEKITLYFRGESKCGWDLVPSVMRDCLVASERDMLVDLVSRRPEEFNGMTSALAQWVLAQHHGLRTRFLDITKNPVVALFHACEEDRKHDGRLHVFAVPKDLVKPFSSDVVSIIANFARLSRDDQEILLGKRRIPRDRIPFNLSKDKYPEAMNILYQLVQQEKPYFDKRIDPRDLYRVFVVEPQQSSERLRAQSGAFLVSAFQERLERDEIVKLKNGIPVYAHYKLTIPGGSKESILKSLQMLNITRETMYPGLEESAKAVMESYRQQRQ